MGTQLTRCTCGHLAHIVAGPCLAIGCDCEMFNPVENRDKRRHVDGGIAFTKFTLANSDAVYHINKLGYVYRNGERTTLRVSSMLKHKPTFYDKWGRPLSDRTRQKRVRELRIWVKENEFSNV